MKKFVSVALTSIMLCLSGATYAQDADFDRLDLGGDESYGYGISADGSTVFGLGYTGVQYDAYYWTAAGGIQSLGRSYAQAATADGSFIVGSTFGGGFYRATIWEIGGGSTLLGTLGGNASSAQAVSQDGSVVLGTSQTGVGFNTAFFRWTQGTGMVSLGTLGGTQAVLEAASTDATAFTGYSNNGAAQARAVRWTQADGLVDLGTLGGTTSYGNDISADGSTVVGRAATGIGFQQLAFIWTEDDGMVSLGNLGSVTGGSIAEAISADGRVVVGAAANTLDNLVAFRWTEEGGMENLGTLEGGTFSRSRDVSADGSVIVGWSESTAYPATEAFRWTAATGMQSLREILTDAGVDLTGWDFTDDGYGNFISADGSVITGTAYFNGNYAQYIFTMQGLITPEEFAKSMASIATPSQQARGAVAQTTSGFGMMVARNAMQVYFPKMNAQLVDNRRAADEAAGFENMMASMDDGVLSQMAPAAGGDDGARGTFATGRRRAVYAVGNLGAGQNNNFSNHAASGATGVLVQAGEHLAVGGGVAGSYSNTETRLDGESRTGSAGVTVVAAFEPPSGVRVYGAASVAALDVSTDRNYINGGGLDGSSGETDGIGYGAVVRGGYEFELYEQARVMPYAEIDVSHVSLDGYTETGGGFPATVDDQSDTYVATRLGAEISHDIGSDATLRGRAAWGHRHTDGGTVNANVLALSQSLEPDAGDRDWLEAGLGINYALSDKTTISADVTGRAGKTAEPAVSATLGFVWNWD